MNLNTASRRDPALHRELARLHASGRLCFALSGAEFKRVRSDAETGDAQQEPSSALWSATISTPAEDEYESIIHSEGVDLSIYADNPVVYWDHGWLRDEPPIGSANSVNVVADPLDWRRNRVDATWTVGTGYEPAEMVRKMLEQRIVRKTSVAFVPTRMDIETERSVVDNKERTRDVLHIYEWRMFEFSPVGLPANHEATIHYDKAQVLSYPSQQAEARAHVASLLTLHDKGADVAMLRGSVAPLLALYGVDVDAIEAGQRAQRDIDNMLNIVEALGRDGAEAAAVIASALSVEAGS